MWLNAMIQYEIDGGYIPEEIKSAIYRCYSSRSYEVEIYGAPFHVLRDDIQVVFAWIEQNGPDHPLPVKASCPKADTPKFGL